MKVTSPWFCSGSLHEMKCLGPFPRVGYVSEELSVSQRGVQPVHVALPGQSHADERKGLKFAWHLGKYGLCSSSVLDCPLQNHIKAVSFTRIEQKILCLVQA